MASDQAVTLLQVAQFYLGFPQADVLLVEAYTAVTTDTDENRLALGLIEHLGHKLPVYALTDQLTPCASRPADDRYLLCLQSPQQSFALMGQAVIPTTIGQLQYDSPCLPCMGRLAHLGTSLFVHQTRVGTITNAARVARTLDLMGGNRHVA